MPLTVTSFLTPVARSWARIAWSLLSNSSSFSAMMNSFAQSLQRPMSSIGRVDRELLDDGLSGERAELRAAVWDSRSCRGCVRSPGRRCRLPHLRVRDGPARVHRADLADERLHPRVAGRDVDDVAARVRRPPEADALGVALLLADDPVDRVQDVGRLVDRVDDLANLLDLGDQLAVLLLGGLPARISRESLLPQPR